MIILSQQGACFVSIPKSASMSMSKFFEEAFRQEESPRYDVEGMHEWHASIREVEDAGRLPFSLYDLWSFAIVRNPFDRLVSYCAFSDPDFSQDAVASIRSNVVSALDGEADRWMLPQTYFASEVRTIYRFEDLPAAVTDIRNRLDIPTNIQFPALNESERGPRYAPYFNRELKEMVEELYSDDFHNFEYRF